MHIAIAVIVGLIIVNFVVQRTIVNNHSMEPSLYENDNLWVEKVSPKIGMIKPGDIVTIYVPEFVPEERNPIIKRVVAVENDRVEIKDGKLYVNDKLKEEDYITGNYTEMGSKPEYSNLTVPKGHIYVLGDNRGNSIDSREIGPVDMKRIRGKAILRFYPLDRFGFLKK